MCLETYSLVVGVSVDECKVLSLNLVYLIKVGAFSCFMFFLFNFLSPFMLGHVSLHFIIF